MAGKLDLMTARYHVSANITRNRVILLQMYQSFQNSGVPASGLRSWGYECQITPRWHVILKNPSKNYRTAKSVAECRNWQSLHIRQMLTDNAHHKLLKPESMLPSCNPLSVPTFCPCKISHIIFQTRKINISNRRLHARTPICYTKEISSEGEW